ncbi:MAG: hypothetical protein MJY85_08155 [Fibrobacter sp.]|nr:hypothetical protein [Fibrobacter sp.]
MKDFIPQRTAASAPLASKANGKKRKIPLKKDFFNHFRMDIKANVIYFGSPPFTKLQSIPIFGLPYASIV